MAIFTSSGHTNGDEAPSSFQRRSFSDKIKNKDRGTPSRETKASDSTVQNKEKIDRQSPSSNNNFVKVKKRKPLIPLMRSSGNDGNVDSSSSGSGELVEVRNKRLTAHSYRALLNRMAERFENTDGGRISQTKTSSEGEGTEAELLQKDDSETLQLIKFTSHGGPFPKMQGAPSSSSFYSDNRVSSQCLMCSQPQRKDNGSQLPVFCCCNAKAGWDLSATSENLGGARMKDNIGSTSGNLCVSHLDSSPAIQRDGNHTLCIVCKHPGSLLHCGGKGCKAGYHLACVDPPLSEIPHGLWLCFCCLRKKMEFGIYSVSEGMESIWDTKEEMQKERHYLVKYKGVAHFYNLWIPESHLLHEDPKLLAKFKKKQHKEQVNGWKQEWTEPHRLLQKRFLIPPEHENECSCGHGNDFEYCYVEWLVKWKGLGYEHATWEFESSPFLCSVEGKALVNDYERRREKARKASDPSRADKYVLLKEDLFHKLPSLSNRSPYELDNDHVDSTRRILKSWHQRQNAVLIDDQEQIVRSILFISKLQPYTCRPFLIISTTSALPIWEAGFARLAPSINVVVYNGNRNVRKLIQALEFYEEGGCIMFEVLLTCPSIVVEDLEAFDCIGWETVVIEDFQKSGVSKHFEQFVNLPSEFRLLLLSTQPKDNVVDYVKLLSFLDPRGQETAVNSKFDRMNSNGVLSILKERFGKYLVHERKHNSSIFTEYWVPVQISEVQLKQYCHILASNSHSLRSRVRVDCAESLLDVLVSIRKCCDHPYLADESLQNSLTKTISGVELLNVGVNVSGKLQLLDKILQEMKNRGLKVLILFQSSIASERNRMGDILYDFLCQRFGNESFGYVDRRKNKSQMEPILQSFNGKGREKFIIVLETRACRPWIKLLSVDAVVIYDSDWNPLNDLKALRKITIDSPVQQAKVFRLYSPYTVEEKVLMLATKDAGLEGDIENTSIRLRHTLLSWGAAQLFDKFNEFCQPDSSNSHPKPFSDNFLLNDMLDLLTRLPENIDAIGKENRSNIVKAHLNGASYSNSISLYGEKGDCSFDGDQTLFWSNLLETISRKLKCIYGPPPRIQRSIEAPDEFAKRPEAEGCDLEKGRKLGRHTTESISKETLRCREHQDEGLSKSKTPEQTILLTASQPSSIPTSKEAVADDVHIRKSVILGASKSQPNAGLQDLTSSTAMATEVTRNLQLSNLSFNSKLHNFVRGPLGRGKQLDAQNEVQDLLKTELLQLFETLRFPENAKGIAEQFLEYILKNRYVCLERTSILQAFILSLCWCAASFSKHEVDHKESLACAKKYLKFECKEKQVETVYEKLWLLKDNFFSLGLSTNIVELNSLQNQLNKPITDAVDLMHDGDSNKSSSDDQDRAEEIKEYSLIAHVKKHPCMKKVQKSAKTENQLCSSNESTVGHSNPASANFQDMVEEGQLFVPTKDLLKQFLQQGNPKELAPDHQEPEQSYMPSPSDKVAEDLMRDHSSDILPFGHVDQEEGKIKENSNIQSCSEQPTSEELLSLLKDKLLEKKKSLIELIYSERLNQLLDMQKMELKEFKSQANLEKQELTRTHCLEMDMSSAPNTDTEVSSDMRKLQQELFKKMDHFDRYMKCQRNRLLKMQIEARNKEKQLKDHWLEEAKTGRLTESYEKLPLSSTGFRLEKFKFGEQVEVRDSGNVFTLCGSSSDAIRSVIEPNSSSDAVIAIAPNDGMQLTSTEKAMPICDSKLLIAVESAEQHRLIFRDSTCNLCPVDELHHSSSMCNVSSQMVVVSKEACSVFPASICMEDREEMHTENETPTNQSIVADTVESVDPSRTSSHVSETVPSEGSSDICLETEILVSQHEIRNATDEDLDGLGITSRTLAEHHGDAKPEGACLTSSLQSPTHIASISRASNFEGCRNSVLHSQVPSVVELETTAVSETASGPACSIPSDTGVPISDSCNTEQMHPVLSLLPPPTGVTSVMSSHEEEGHAHAGSGHEPRDQVHCSAQLNGLSTPSNNSSLESLILPVHPVSNNLPENLQVHRLNSTAVQPEMASYSRVLCAPRQPLSQKELHSDPLLNERSWLHRAENELVQLHTKKKRHLEIECEKELETVRKKYASLIQDDEADFVHHFTNVKKFQSFIDMQQNIAESFRGNLLQKKQGSAVSQGQPSSPVQQVHQLPCSEIAQRSVLASSSVPAPSPSPPFLDSPGVPGSSSLLPSVHSPQPLLNSSAVPTSSLANPYRNPMLLPPENLHVRSDLRPQLLHLHPSRSQPNILLQNCQVTYPQDFRLV